MMTKANLVYSQLQEEVKNNILLYKLPLGSSYDYSKNFINLDEDQVKGIATRLHIPYEEALLYALAHEYGHHLDNKAGNLKLKYFWHILPAEKRAWDYAQKEVEALWEDYPRHNFQKMRRFCLKGYEQKQKKEIESIARSLAIAFAGYLIPFLFVFIKNAMK